MTIKKTGIHTLKTWIVYQPERQAILSWHATKKAAMQDAKSRRRDYACVFQLKGTYAAGNRV